MQSYLHLLIHILCSIWSHILLHYCAVYAMLTVSAFDKPFMMPVKLVFHNSMISMLQFGLITLVVNVPIPLKAWAACHRHNWSASMTKRNYRGWR